MTTKIKFLTISVVIIACISTGITFLVINQNKSVRLSKENGLSAYELAVECGYDGSIQEWINSTSDKSSYEIAKDIGFDKSENEWMKLINEKSEKGNAEIKTAEISQKGDLIITLTDNTRINVGKAYVTDNESTVKGITVSESNELIIVTGDSKEYIIGSLKGDELTSSDNEEIIINAEISDNGQLDITLGNGDKTDSQVSQTKTPSICVQEVKSYSGEIVDISVCIFNNSGINGAEFDISYDSRLKLVGAQNGEALKSLRFTVPGVYSNPSKFLWDGISENEKGNGVALTLSFSVPSDAKAGDKYSVSVSYPKGAIYDSNLNDVDFDTVSGSITIK